MTLIATDSGGLTAFATFTLTVNNVPPTNTTFDVPSGGTEGNPMTLAATATDPAGALDPLLFQWTINEPNGTIFSSVGPSFDFTPGDSGGYHVTLNVSDDDGGNTIQMADVFVNDVPPSIAVQGGPGVAEGER